MTQEDQQDVIAVLVQDHHEFEQMFAELEGLSGSTDDKAQQRRKDFAEQVVIELVRHSVAEEAEVYPRIRERVDKAEADRLTQEQAEAEQTMKKLEKLSPDQPDFDTELSRLMSEIRAHVAEEEQQAFPQMRSTFTADELLEMGRKVESVKKMAPTRPHPAAPDQPPGDKLLGPTAGLVDRMRDALTGRALARRRVPDRTAGPAEPNATCSYIDRPPSTGRTTPVM